MPFWSQSLRQSICHHILHWTVFQLCRSIFNAAPDEVVLDVDMLCTCMVFRIVCEGDSTLIVTVDGILVADVVADFFEEAVEPDEVLEGMKESHVFRFRAREGDRALLLRRVSDRSTCNG